MSKKNIIQKLKIGFIGISTIGMFLLSCSNHSRLEKNNEIAHKILQIEDSADNIPFNTCPSIQTLDSLIDNSKEYIEKKEFYTKEDLGKISEKIYSEINKLKEIKKREDLCYRSALIYLAIGNANEIPFDIIDIPESNHVFIKYTSINKKSLNIETTTGEIQESKNGKYSNFYYINKFAITKNSLEKNTSLKNLNEEELLSLAYTQIAVNYLKNNIRNQGNSTEVGRKKAIENCNKAIALDSNSQSAYLTLGIAESMDNKFPISYESQKRAIKSFEKALEINPSANIYYLIGNSQSQLGERKKAIENYTNAINSIYKLREEFNKPSNYLKNLEMKCLFWRANMYGELGYTEEAKKDKKKFNNN